MKCVWIGTSGWVYKHWAETFYPADWPKKDEFQFYITQFPTVEINATFYRLPSENMVKGWHRNAPDDFLFAAKGSRFITHIKRLKNCKEALKVYFEHIRGLREHLGPILWQLPPSFHNTDENRNRLGKFLPLLPSKYRHVIEFRHPSWIESKTFDLLRSHNIANCWLSSLRMPDDFTMTADFVYLRFHGLAHGAYHDYTIHELRPWAERLIDATRSNKTAYVYFNNDLNTRAPLNAKALMEMVGGMAVQPAEVQLHMWRSQAVRRPDATKPVHEPRSKRLRKRSQGKIVV